MKCENGVLWTRLERVGVKELDKYQPRIVATPCTGTDHIDLAECQRRNIKVLSLRDTDVLPAITATAEHTIGLILALVRKIPSAVDSVKRGQWERERFMGRELRDMEALIFGEGRIGKLVEAFISPLVCNAEFANPWFMERIYRLKEYDIVTMHVDLNPTSHRMCGPEFFAHMKLGSYFINTSRGQVVDESALLGALRSGHLTGAALDVVCGEPDQINPYLLAYARDEPQRLIITPHLGGCAVEAIEKAEAALAERLVAELSNGR